MEALSGRGPHPSHRHLFHAAEPDAAQTSPKRDRTQSACMRSNTVIHSSFRNEKDVVAGGSCFQTSPHDLRQPTAAWSGPAVIILNAKIRTDNRTSSSLTMRY